MPSIEHPKIIFFRFTLIRIWWCSTFDAKEGQCRRQRIAGEISLKIIFSFYWTNSSAHGFRMEIKICIRQIAIFSPLFWLLFYFTASAGNWRDWWWIDERRMVCILNAERAWLRKLLIIYHHRLQASRFDALRNMQTASKIKEYELFQESVCFLNNNRPWCVFTTFDWIKNDY